MKKEWKTMLVLLMPVMMFMWLISGLFIWGLVPPINYVRDLQAADIIFDLMYLQIVGSPSYLCLYLSN